MAEEDELVGQQVAYYRARAPEYDDWFLCRGRYDRGPDHTNRWVSEVEMDPAELQARLERSGWEGTVSETPEFFIWGKLRNADA